VDDLPLTDCTWPELLSQFLDRVVEQQKAEVENEKSAITGESL
jgi:hypothetical protein